MAIEVAPIARYLTQANILKGLNCSSLKYKWFRISKSLYSLYIFNTVYIYIVLVQSFLHIHLML